MWDQSKKYKKIAFGVILVFVLMLGLSRLKLQSVYSFQKEQKQIAQELGLDDAGQEPEKGLVTDGDGWETAEKASEQKQGNAKSQGGQRKDVDQTGDRTKNAAKEPSEKEGTQGKDSPTRSGGSKGKQKNGRGNTDGEYSPLGGTGKDSQTGASQTGNHSSSVGKDNDTQDGTGQNSHYEGQNNISSSSSDGVSSSAPSKPTPAASSTSTAAKEKITCVVQIRCDELVQNKDRIASSLWKYIPSDGMLLSETKVTVAKGATAYDVLSQICKAKNIALDSEYTAMYNSYYVRGIGYLYEKQAGDRSGWIYTINGKSPNRGASGFTLSEGDQMTWFYTCDGKG